MNSQDLVLRIEKLNEIGVALSAEKDTTKLLEMILEGAKGITNADGGTLYSKTEEGKLKFEIMKTDSLGIALGGASKKPIPFPPLPLHDDSDRPNKDKVVVCAVLEERTIRIPDAYSATGFDFTGTKAFDKSTGYRSKSFLTIPMKNHENEITGVLQLINAKDEITGETISFSHADEHLVESLASQAAVAITNKQLIHAQRKLFESFIQLIASAIDDKSPYTGGHCERVPEITMMLAEAANKKNSGPLKDFCMNEEEKYELKIAAWLHDCGKVTTPEYVVDKSTKLETIFDRVHLLDTRFEVLKRDAEIDLLRKKIAALEAGKSFNGLEREYKEKIETFEADKKFINECNFGGEFMSDELKERVNSISRYKWIGSEGKEENFLSENEVDNLNISKGTLTPDERQVINHHIEVTIKMLEQLPYPKNLRSVPEFAGGHHERMDGKGYPRGLTRDQMSVQARIMGIADIFEALTAKDRPYKKGKTLSESLRILGFFKQDNHIDPDLFNIFIDQKVYLQYAEQFLSPDQIDEVDLSKIPGYILPEKREVQVEYGYKKAA